MNLPKSGDIVRVRYLDHVLFKDSPGPLDCKPSTRETIGWLDHLDQDYVRIVWETASQPSSPGENRTRWTGLTILRKAILEMKTLI